MSLHHDFRRLRHIFHRFRLHLLVVLFSTADGQLEDSSTAADGSTGARRRAARRRRRSRQRPRPLPAPLRDVLAGGGCVRTRARVRVLSPRPFATSSPAAAAAALATVLTGSRAPPRPTTSVLAGGRLHDRVEGR
uniref:Secreted protein n=1 Tax=Oryza meridionalis TaxID=40149 RepID=A0A0E0CQL4_9ORYZ